MSIVHRYLNYRGARENFNFFKVDDRLNLSSKMVTVHQVLLTGSFDVKEKRIVSIIKCGVEDVTYPFPRVDFLFPAGFNNR